MSEVEDALKMLNTLRANLSATEDGMRNIRLGGGVEMRFKKFFWRDMVIAGGWGHQKSEPLPAGIESEFYLFLSDKARALAEEIRAKESLLSSIRVPVGDADDKA